MGASLSNGELLVHLRFNQTPENYTVGGTRLDNGHLHLIEVTALVVVSLFVVAWDTHCGSALLWALLMSASERCVLVFIFLIC